MVVGEKEEAAAGAGPLAGAEDLRAVELDIKGLDQALLGEPVHLKDVVEKLLIRALNRALYRNSQRVLPINFVLVHRVI